MTLLDQVRAVRRGAGLFRLPRRAVIEVRGRDRVRWLNGMLSNDVAALEQQGPRSGCYALLLTAQGRIVADVHVLYKSECYWLETERAALSGVVSHLLRFVIADDVEIGEPKPELARLAVEGPAAPALLTALPVAAPEPDGWVGLTLAGAELVLAAYSLAGGPGFQILAPAARLDPVHDALLALGAPRGGLIPAEPATLEVLRIEAGVPWLGQDLDESVLPDEARLESAVSTSKGCFTGQEVVARMRSRGRVSHLLVGLHFEDEAPPPPGAAVNLAGKRIGEVTSSTRSPSAGAIALAYLRRPHDETGTWVEAGGSAGRVVELPFVSAACEP